MSLAYIVEQCTGQIGFDATGIQALIQGLQQGENRHPAVFSIYFDLVACITEGDYARAESLFAQLADTHALADGLHIIPLGRSSYARRYRALMSEESAAGFRIAEPAKKQAMAYRNQIEQGIALMQRALPELAGEVYEIVHELIMVTGNGGSDCQFDGGSHYQLWGALFLNADIPRKPCAMVEAIAHESAHSLLFGFCIDEPLVVNTDEQLFSSPLRHDHRPMDGIYHATFVSARMHWAMTGLLDSGELAPAEREIAEQAKKQHATAFAQGHQVVTQYGRMTDLGRSLMEGAQAYMGAT